MLTRTGLMVAAILAPGPSAWPQDARNLALAGVARSWLENSGLTVSPHVVNDGNLTTWWGSNDPTPDPPKDIGIEWQEARTFSCVRVHFFSMDYVPAVDGWRVETLVDDEWRAPPATVDNPDCERWTFRFPRVTAQAVRLVVSAYAGSRPAVREFEVYEQSPPDMQLRRAPLLDGAFWAFHYPHWAQRWDDAALAAEVDRAHAIGVDTLMLYTVMGRDGEWATVMPDAPLPQIAAWSGRDPLEVILSRADALGMRAYLGDAPPTGYSLVGEEQTVMAASRERLDAYRRALLARYGAHPSLVGYYLNFELCPDNFGNDPAEPARQVEQLAAFISALRPDLEIVLPVGLYRWRDTPERNWRFVGPDEIRAFWRPFIAAVPDVDVIMVIDGCGTGLSPLALTDLNQAAVRAICDELGKTMWTDVECAVMGQGGYHSFPIGRLVPSIEVAAQHANYLVTFDYPNYLSPTNGREPSARLYEAYRVYRNTVLGRW
ncbi:MAG: DUF4434 domain-containing protein [Armatimonadota bacterium]